MGHGFGGVAWGLGFRAKRDFFYKGPCSSATTGVLRSVRSVKKKEEEKSAKSTCALQCTTQTKEGPARGKLLATPAAPQSLLLPFALRLCRGGVVGALALALALLLLVVLFRILEELQSVDPLGGDR